MCGRGAALDRGKNVQVLRQECMPRVDDFYVHLQAERSDHCQREGPELSAVLIPRKQDFPQALNCSESQLWELQHRF